MPLGELSIMKAKNLQIIKYEDARIMHDERL